MLHSTSLIALVGAGEQAAFSPRRLRIFNTKTAKYICELNFLSTVLQVRLSYSHLVAVLERKIHLFDLRTMKMLHTLDTPANPRGLCALTAAGGAAAGPHGAPTGSASTSPPPHAFICYPASDERGELFVYDALNLRTVACIRAHNTPLRCASFNATGSMLATCSQQGTVIRVFSVPGGKKLFTFRRGTYPAKINSIAFNRSGDMLVVSSDDSSTVHGQKQNVIGRRALYRPAHLVRSLTSLGIGICFVWCVARM
jgi:autophagy-related protein 18